VIAVTKSTTAWKSRWVHTEGFYFDFSGRMRAGLFQAIVPDGAFFHGQPRFTAQPKRIALSLDPLAFWRSTGPRVRRYLV
jgi:hypothetical protein